MSSAQRSPRAARSVFAGIAAFSLVALGLVVAEPAVAATSIAVSTTIDADANAACSTPSVVTTATPVTLRNALCVANNIGGSTTVTVPAGAYALTTGPLIIGTESGTSVQLIASGGRPVITGDGSTQILTIDPGLLGGIDVEIDGFEFRGGRDSVFGGGAIIGGSFEAADPDTLVIDDTVFADNMSTGGTANPGGAIQFIGGDLTITGSKFNANRSGPASGGAVYYEATSADDVLTVSGSDFSDNHVTATGIAAGGGAIAVGGSVSSSVQITGNVFIANSATGAGAGAGALESVSAAITAQYNSFLYNDDGGTGVRAAGTLTNNWWGCNGGPGANGCDTNSASSGTASPYLVMTATTTDETIETTESTTLTASLRTNSNGDAIDGADLVGFDGATVQWSAVTPAGASVSPNPSPLVSGESTATFVAGDQGGYGGVFAFFDSASELVPITVLQTPAFTTAEAASATVGVPFQFTVATSGFPQPSVSADSASLAPGLSMDITSGGGIISGTPTTPGVYPVTLTASNGWTHVTQVLTITVGAAPAFTSTLSATAAAGDPLDVEITTSGSPAPTISATTLLPDGVALTDNGDGTARLHGTPTVAPGSYEFGLAASNAIGTAPATFALTITADPGFTSADHATFAAGTAGSFAIGVDAGFPALNTVTVTGAPAWLSLVGTAGAQQLQGTPPAGSGGTYTFTLAITGSAVSQTFTLTVSETPVITSQPASRSAIDGTDAAFTATASGYPAPTVQWQRFTGGTWSDISGATTTTLTLGATMADDGARVRAVFTSSAGTATSNEAVLTVGQLPHVNPVAPVTADAGSQLDVAVTTSGLPHGTITASGLPSWLSFTDNGDGTAALSGIPSLGDVGAVTVTVTTDNGFGADSTPVQITVVGEVPAFTSTLAATVAAGDALDETITAVGIPAPSLSATGLPAGLELTDDGDGTGHLSGTPDVAPGVHTFDITATNPHGSTTSTFTVTIIAPPAFTSADHASFTAAAQGSFAVTVDPGYPQLGTVTLTGAPTWLDLVGGALIGTPPAGSGGTYAFELSIDGSDVVQQFTLTVNEAPVITEQPAALTLLEGEDAVFTSAASGYPAPAVQWQRFSAGSWTDIAGATTTTLSFAAAASDDGSRVRAVFTSPSGTALSDDAVLTVGQVPVFVDIDPVIALAGGALTIDIASTGLPAGAITASGTPAWLSFDDNGDGTATLAGTPALADAGDASIVLSVDNGFGTDEMTVQLTVRSEVPLPLLVDLADGALTGVPPTVLRGQQITIGGTGFLPGAVIQLGIYSVPTVLGTAVADASGAFSALITIPADQSLGAHTVAASGISSTGTAQLLAAGTTVVLPPSTGGGSTGGSTGPGSTGGLPATGLDGSQSLGLVLVALFAVLAGVALMRAARRRWA